MLLNFLRNNSNTFSRCFSHLNSTTVSIFKALNDCSVLDDLTGVRGLRGVKVVKQSSENAIDKWSKWFHFSVLRVYI